MKILVDFDNIEQRIRSQGLIYLLEKVVCCIQQEDLGEQARVKLYGGWYQNERFTARAQKISQQIDKNFPRYLKIRGGKRVALIPEIARTLEASPRQNIYHTYRDRPLGENLNTNDHFSCQKNECPAITLINFLRNKACPAPLCSVKQKEVLVKREQKLVDSMLVADIIFLAVKNQNTLCIVSSDDDIYPGIITALMQKSKVVHIKHRKKESGRFDFLDANCDYTKYYLD